MMQGVSCSKLRPSTSPAAHPTAPAGPPAVALGEGRFFRNFSRPRPVFAAGFVVASRRVRPSWLRFVVTSTWQADVPGRVFEAGAGVAGSATTAESSIPSVASGFFLPFGYIDRYNIGGSSSATSRPLAETAVQRGPEPSVQVMNSGQQRLRWATG